MASVTARKNRSGTVSWRVMSRVDGKLVQESFANEDVARTFDKQVDRVGWAAAKAMRDARSGKRVVTPTFSEFATTYLDEDSGMLTGISAGTRAGYVSIMRRGLEPVLGEIPIDSVTKNDVGRWLSWQQKQLSGRNRISPTLVSAKTIHNYHALLSAIFTAAVESKLRADNPARGTRLPEGERREPVMLSREEFDLILEQIPQRHRPFVTFLVGSQCRFGEATAVTWGDINRSVSPPSVRINKAWKKGPNTSPVLGLPKSKKGRRTIALWDALVAELGEPGAPGELVFQNERGGHIWHSAFNTRVWRPAVARAKLGKEPNPHDLRHTGASWLIAQGVPLPFIQNRLGHEKIATTVDLYGHLLPAAHVEMADAMQRAMGHGLLRELE